MRTRALPAHAAGRDPDRGGHESPRDRLKAGKDPAAEFASAGLTPEEVRSSPERQLVIARYSGAVRAAFADEQQAREEYAKRHAPEQTRRQPAALFEAVADDAQTPAGLRRGGRAGWATCAKSRVSIYRMPVGIPSDRVANDGVGPPSPAPTPTRRPPPRDAPDHPPGAWLSSWSPRRRVRRPGRRRQLHDVAVTMRDGVVLRADVRPGEGSGRFPTLILRTPTTRAPRKRGRPAALARGYAIVLQDVRGLRLRWRVRAVPERGSDGYDTIERLPRRAGPPARSAFGLSYPAAVQWLAAGTAAPEGDGPAMTFSSPTFFYAGGAWDCPDRLIWDNIAPTRA
jgi:hypothetical protein